MHQRLPPVPQPRRRAVAKSASQAVSLPADDPLAEHSSLRVPKHRNGTAPTPAEISKTIDMGTRCLAMHMCVFSYTYLGCANLPGQGA